MNTKTGQTVYEDIMSLDMNNLPVSSTTFDAIAILNGVKNSGVTINMSLVDAERGIFSASWSASTIGNYQIYIKNIGTNSIFISNLVNVRPDSEFDQTIYIGL